MPLLLLPIFWGLDIYSIVKASHFLGGLYTFLALIADAFIGFQLISLSGITAMRRSMASMVSGKMPSDDILAGFVYAFAGLLLIWPGFVSDAFALLLLLGGKPLRLLIMSRFSRINISANARGNPFGRAAKNDPNQPVTLDGDFRKKPNESDRLP